MNEDQYKSVFLHLNPFTEIIPAINFKIEYAEMKVEMKMKINLTAVDQETNLNI